MNNTGLELTPEQIEKCIADNVTITDWHLRDGVIGAVMDAVALFAKENEMLLGSLPEPVVEAYGWLWHDVSVNVRTRKARQLLTVVMTKEQMRAGIQMAKEAGAAVRASTVSEHANSEKNNDNSTAVPSTNDLPRSKG